MNKSKSRVVQETTLGTYVATSFGVPIDDGAGHVLAIGARQNDKAKIKTLMQTAASYGYENLDYKFMPGVRPVSDDEYLIQQQRMEAGLQPDPYEMGSAIDAYRQATLK